MQQLADILAISRPFLVALGWLSAAVVFIWLGARYAQKQEEDE